MLTSAEIAPTTLVPVPVVGLDLGPECVEFEMDIVGSGEGISSPPRCFQLRPPSTPTMSSKSRQTATNQKRFLVRRTGAGMGVTGCTGCLVGTVVKDRGVAACPVTTSGGAA